MSTESAAETRVQEDRPDENDARIGDGGYVLIGAVCGLVALFVYPPGFGVLSMICGVQLFRRRSEPLRLAMMGWGGMGLTLVMILGARL